MTFRILIGGWTILLASQVAFAGGPSVLRFNLPDRSYTSGSRVGSRVIAPRFGALERSPRYNVGAQGPSRRVPIIAPRSAISFQTRSTRNLRSYPPQVYRAQRISPQRLVPASPPAPTHRGQIPVLRRDRLGREFIVSEGQTIYFDQ